MKKLLVALAITVVSAVSSTTSFAQDNQTETTSLKTPKWVAADGYWVIESNIKNPKHNTVYFYNNNDVLVYKETTDGIALNIKKRRTKMHLKKLVDETVSNYAKAQKASENKMLVASLIKR